MNKKIVIIIIITTIAFILLGLGIYLLMNDKGATSLTNKNLEYQDFVIKSGHKGLLKEYDKTLYVEGYKGNYDEAYYIEGILNSKSTITYNFIVVTFNLLDKNNKIIGEAICGLENIEPNKDYNFKAMSLTTTEDAKKVVSYELKSVEQR